MFSVILSYIAGDQPGIQAILSKEMIPSSLPNKAFLIQRDLQDWSSVRAEGLGPSYCLGQLCHYCDKIP